MVNSSQPAVWPANCIPFSDKSSAIRFLSEEGSSCCSYTLVVLLLFLPQHIYRPPLGLMHRTILLSGSALSPWAMAPDPDAVREEVSQQMACHLAAADEAAAAAPPQPPATTKKKATPSSDVTSDITGCLKSKPLEALMGVRLPVIR